MTTPHVFRTTILSGLLALLLLSITVPGQAQPPSHRDILYQASTIEALLAGQYDATTTCGAVKQHGDFGLGTFTGLDGEMVVHQGVIYKVAYDGSVTPMPDSEGTPFAAVTWFDADQTSLLPPVATLNDLKGKVTALLPGTNRFYAIRITGSYTYIKTRSVPKQTKPYPPLVDIVAKQAVFERENVRGTLIGIFAPNFVEHLNVPGYHFHFISDDKTFGGHVLDLKANGLSMELDITNGFAMQLPKSEEFQKIKLGKDKRKELHSVESEAKD